MTIKILNRVAAKQEKPLHTSRGSDHAGMIGSRQRIPSGPVVLSLLAGHSQRKQAGHMTAQTVLRAIPRQNILDSRGPSTHDGSFIDGFASNFSLIVFPSNIGMAPKPLSQLVIPDAPY